MHLCTLSLLLCGARQALSMRPLGDEENTYSEVICDDFIVNLLLILNQAVAMLRTVAYYHSFIFMLLHAVAGH